MAEELIRARDVQTGHRNVLPTGTEVVASYNWSVRSREGHPRIIVPGAPRNYVSRMSRRVFVLGKDGGDSFVDENRARMKQFSSVEPLFRSLDICSPNFDISTVDIVTDRNNLRNLLRFCRSPGDTTTTNEFGNQDFKFFIHSIGDSSNGQGDPTLVFTRATVGHHNIYGYGHNFEKKLTEKDSHAPWDAGTFRVVTKMKIDGMALLVRSEVDACDGTGSTRLIPEGKERASSSGGGGGGGDRGGGGANTSAKADAKSAEDLLVEQLGGLGLSSSSSGGGGKSESKPTSGLTCEKRGQLLGHDAKMLELKTKNSRYADEINWKDIYWQMALGGAHSLVLGLHNRGTFGAGDVRHHSIGEVKASAEESGSPSMVFLANTLRGITKAAHRIIGAASTAPAPPAAPTAPSAASGGRGGTGKRGESPPPPRVAAAAAVVVEYSPGRDSRRIRVRLATAADGAVPPF